MYPEAITDRRRGAPVSIIPRTREKVKLILLFLFFLFRLHGWRLEPVALHVLVDGLHDIGGYRLSNRCAHRV